MVVFLGTTVAEDEQNTSAAVGDAQLFEVCPTSKMYPTAAWVAKAQTIVGIDVDESCQLLDTVREKCFCCSVIGGDVFTLRTYWEGTYSCFFLLDIFLVRLS